MDTNSDSSSIQNFSNEALNIDLMPSISNLTFKAISPTYAKANRYINVMTTLMLMLITVSVHYQTFFEITSHNRDLLLYITWLIGLLGLIITLYNSVANIKKFYSVREHDISYCSGLFFKKSVTQPLTRVQHVELKRGPIDRKVGLAKLQVFSAGGALHTFEIPGLKVAEAETLRQFILSHKDSLQHG
jgi:hypothetical protein